MGWERRAWVDVDARWAHRGEGGRELGGLVSLGWGLPPDACPRWSSSSRCCGSSWHLLGLTARFRNGMASLRGEKGIP